MSPRGEPPVPAPRDRSEEESPTRELIALRLGAARFGIWIEEALEIVRTPPISRLPVSPPEVAGVTSVRGEVVPILDLGVRLMGRPAARPGRLLLVRLPDDDGLVALLVDEVETLIAVRDSDVREPPAEAAAQPDRSFMEGVVHHPDGAVTVLRLPAAAAPPAQSEKEE